MEDKIFDFGKEKPYKTLKNKNLQYIQDFISDYFDYTTEISVTEDEWFSKFEWLEDYIIYRDTTDEDYHREALKDLLFSLLFNQESIEQQIINDLDNYEVGCAEYQYIKEFYNKWKDLFNFKIDELE